MGASLVREEVSDFEAIVLSVGSSSDFRLQCFLLRILLLALLKQVVSCPYLVLTPPACRRIRVLPPF